jgi:hypothetical protein
MALINYLTRIQFDSGALELLPAEISAQRMSRPLIVTDQGIVKAGVFDLVQPHLPETTTIFDQTPSNPTEAAVLSALEMYKSADCDGVVAIGGGSSLDLAKGVALLATHEGSLEQYALVLGGLSRIGPEVAPLIALPTTAGTGSEVGRGALLTLNDGRKLGFIAPAMIPDVAICDPDLTIGLPPGLTAATGMDALTHCIETFISPQVNPPADAIALDGAARAWSWIETAVADGANSDARWHMMMASLQGGMTFQKGLGAVHAMSHPLGGLTSPNLHHGTLNAVILPAVLRFNEGHVGDKYQRLAGACGMTAEADLATEIETLNARLGLPASLREMGVSADVLPEMAHAAVIDHSTATNPRPASQSDYADLFAASMA